MIIKTQNISSHRTRHSVVSLSIVILLVVFINGCNKDKDKNISSQVIARVNGEEITVHELNYLLRRSKASSEEQAVKIREQVIDKLVDQRLLAQQAINRGLDRKPDVILALELAKSQVLADAYLEQVTQPTTKPSAIDVANYYAANPDLFSKRRIYKFDRLTVPMPNTRREEIKQQAEKSHDLAFFSQWLQNQKIPYDQTTVMLGAEQLPLERLSDFGHMSIGQRISVTNDENLFIFRLLEFKDDPIDEAKAGPMIEVFLVNQRRKDKIDAELNHIKQTAQIVYPGTNSSTAEQQQKTPNTTPARSTFSEQNDILRKGLQGNH